jgi:hypothetical protein
VAGLHGYGIVVVFALLVVVAVGSSAVFRRHSLSTRQRAGMGIVAVGLLVSGLVRDGGFDAGKIEVVVFAVVVIAVAVFYLWRAQKYPPGEK